MDIRDTVRLQFGDFEFDTKSRTLFRDGWPVKIQPQPLRVLAVLLERPGETVSREQLRAQVWGDSTFVEFDQGLNYSVRQIRLALRDQAANPIYIETLPKQGYRFLAKVQQAEDFADALNPAEVKAVAEKASPLPDPALPPAVAAGFADTSASPSMPHRTKVRFPLWVLGSVVSMILISLVFATRWNQTRQDSAALKIDSLAVLPLDNLSGDSSQDYLAAGMTDELITMLAKNSTLRIVSRTSAMQFKGAHRPLPELARELGVDGIVEGSLSRSGHGVHLAIQVIHAASDTHIWAESYDRDSNDAASLPSEVARAVAKRLHCAVPEPARERYVGPEAHDAYLRGHYLWFRGHDDQAAEYFKKAIELQPDYALAWTGVADVNGAEAFYKRSPKVANGQAKAAALKAASLDDSLAQAHLTLCMITFSADWDWSRALQECGRAIELDPKLSEAYHFRSEILAALNRQTEALVFARKAAELDGFSRPWALSASLLRARQFDAAINEARARLEVDPHEDAELGVLDSAYRAKGMWKEAFESSNQRLVLQGNATRASDELHDFQRGGYLTVIQRRLNYWKKQAQSHYVSTYILAGLAAQLRQRDETLDFLAQALEEHQPDLVFIQCDPAFDFLHADERYRSIVRGIGLPPAY